MQATSVFECYDTMVPSRLFFAVKSRWLHTLPGSLGLVLIV